MDLADWEVMLEDARSDADDPETNVRVAAALGMDPLESIYDTLCAYLRGEAGDAPARTGLRIDRMYRDLLLRDGVDPARFLHASQLGLGFGLSLSRNAGWVDRSTIDDGFAPRVNGVTPLMHGVQYDAMGPATANVAINTAIIGRLPDTIVDCLVGRPLSDLLGHSMGSDPVITEVTRVGADIVVDVGECDYVPLQGE